MADATSEVPTQADRTHATVDGPAQDPGFTTDDPSPGVPGRRSEDASRSDATDAARDPAPVATAGTGRGASGSFTASRGLVEADVDGRGVSSVALVDDQGRAVATVRTPGGGTVMLPVSRDGVYAVEVAAEGAWSLQARVIQAPTTDLPLDVRASGTASTEVFSGGRTITLELRVAGEDADVLLTTADGQRVVMTVSAEGHMERLGLPTGLAALTVVSPGGGPWSLQAK